MFTVGVVSAVCDFLTADLQDQGTWISFRWTLGKTAQEKHGKLKPASSDGATDRTWITG